MAQQTLQGASGIHGTCYEQDRPYPPQLLPELLKEHTAIFSRIDCGTDS